MKVFGFNVKRGLVATLAICIAIVVSQHQLIACFWILKMAIRGTPNYCGARPSLDSLAYVLRVGNSEKKILSAARLISTDPAGMDFYEINMKEIWIPKGALVPSAFLLAEQMQGVYTSSNAYIRPGDIVLDVGAHVGTFSREALQRGVSKIIAIEPVPSTVECLRRNLRMEIGQGRAIVYPKGAWDKDDTLEMDLDSENDGRDSFVLKQPGHKTIRLPLTTIDKIVRELGLARVDFIKMDIEGSERHALEGASETIRQFRPRMALCVYHLSDDPIVIPAIIKKLRPDYRQQCGSCSIEEHTLSPQVYFYY